MFSFLIAASGLQILDIGASFWALVLGVFVSLIFETRDFEFATATPGSKTKKVPVSKKVS